MTRTRLALAAVAAAVLLSACQDDDPEPKVADPTPSATSVESPPSQTATTSPVAQPRSPEETVRAWVDAQNHALASGDTTALRELAAEACQGCDDYPDGIDQIVGAGGHFEGGKWSIVRARVQDADANPVRINVGIHIAGGMTVTSAGAAPTTYAPANRLFAFELVNDTGEWLISLVGSLS
ncbi:hypothetical protein G5V58_01170 [Nocardioides anomalus]|uniref:DUF6318 domain-containing protein n=1 Tax=Nocardioides anomalus TaxID=2712223 RepID=A0A6G6W8Y6_9ACTN|nr:DUF6318 family protein [Nocardioides anomalus]QIG41565.1 hypothetical protein G5V58_01170 [Nocardioides anomalus]